MQPTPAPYCPPWKRAWRSLRSLLPFVLGALLFFGYHQYANHAQAHRAALATAVDAGQLNADDPLVAEAAQSAVPPFGDAAGKSVIALGIFFLGLALVWAVMHFVVPVLPNWAKGTYAHDDKYPIAGDFKSLFLELPAKWKFAVFLSCWYFLLGYWDVCWLAASLIK